MALANSTARYGAVSMAFHWLTMLLIFTMIPLGLIANDMAQDLRDPAISNSQIDIQRTALLFSIHKTTGILIFLLTLARLAWALVQTKPAPLHPDRRMETFVAETVHWLLYGALLLVPLSGWAHHAATEGFAPIWWPFGQSLPFIPKDQALAETFATLHIVLERVLVMAILLHVAGAVKHAIVDRDSTLRRMLPGNTEVAATTAPRHTATPAIAALGVWVAVIGGAAGVGLFTEQAVSHSSNAATGIEDPAPQTGIANWQVIDGALGITIQQMGVDVSGEFATWTADIVFDDPDAPGPAGHVEVIIDIASLVIGGVTEQAMGPDFMDAEEFPLARFDADIIKTETGHVATGSLTIRGETRPSSLPFDLIIEGDTATMSGTLTLLRLDYDIGRSITDPASLGPTVEVSVSLTATRSE